MIQPSFCVMGLFLDLAKSATAFNTDDSVREGSEDLEIRPFLLQLGVVHVNCEELQQKTNV